ncbi:hypothetical protein NI456_03730 [Brevundimonas diminuta]|uniref:hypothetical protein n=1 Tax=Brevundimonas diminuta TaxID=293 RepID=UPI0020974976|nr:hypothetical protein [Brevundimonas diminuta]MCO8017963.1 hypothetical protein [Brevundimonas diminuta]MCO8022512.1 hypothetical protein [Brevundimonas diminuta]
MRSTAIILLGQAIWAVAQALMVLAVARAGGLELVGLLVLGLAIFTPACLGTGFNLRALIAIDDADAIDIRMALWWRAWSIIFALAGTALVLALVAGTIGRDWLAATLLVASRASDQSADITTGWYQRANRHTRIGWSFGLRGLASILPIAGVVLFGGGIVLGATLTLITTLLVHIVADISPILKAAPLRPRTPATTFLRRLGSGLKSAPYPLLDSLYASSIRYAAAALLGTQLVGLIGIAQTLYAPIQLLISAIAFRYLTRTRALVVANRRAEQKTLLMQSLVFGLAVGAGFFAASVAFPIEWLTQSFSTESPPLRPALIAIAAMSLPLPMISFLGHYLTANCLFSTQIISILVAGGTAAIILTASFLLPGKPSLAHIVLAFLSGTSARFFICLYGALRDYKDQDS